MPALKAKPLRRCRCGAHGRINFECVDCCIYWLLQMTAEGRRLNAPVIGIMAGQEQLEKVRQTWIERKGEGNGRKCN